MQQNEKVKCDRFSFTYDGGNTFGVHDIDLTIQEGEFIVLTGSSGCGKTTLTRCINGLIIPHCLQVREDDHIIKLVFRKMVVVQESIDQAVMFSSKLLLLLC